MDYIWSISYIDKFNSTNRLFICSSLGIQSPANLVLVFIIFILLIKQFLMTIEMSQLEIKIRELVEEIALKEKKDEEL